MKDKFQNKLEKDFLELIPRTILPSDYVNLRSLFEEGRPLFSIQPQEIIEACAYAGIDVRELLLWIADCEFSANKINNSKEPFIDMDTIIDCTKDIESNLQYLSERIDKLKKSMSCEPSTFYQEMGKRLGKLALILKWSPLFEVIIEEYISLRNAGISIKEEA